MIETFAEKNQLRIVRTLCYQKSLINNDINNMKKELNRKILTSCLCRRVHKLFLVQPQAHSPTADNKLIDSPTADYI